MDHDKVVVSPICSTLHKYSTLSPGHIVVLTSAILINWPATGRGKMKDLIHNNNLEYITCHKHGVTTIYER